MERILDAAKAWGLRSGENPARWRGHLDMLLARQNKLSRGHHAALPYEQVPQFLALLRQSHAMSALALEFLILTAARTGEVIGARWSEIDTGKAIWSVPAVRMKAGREHRVPLSERSLEILASVAPLLTTPDDFVFPGAKGGHGLSQMALAMMLRQCGQAWCHRTRLPFRLPRLGGRRDRNSARDRRGCACPRGRRRDRTCLPPWRRLGQTTGAYGCAGERLRDKEVRPTSADGSPCARAQKREDSLP